MMFLEYSCPSSIILQANEDYTEKWHDVLQFLVLSIFLLFMNASFQ